MLYEARAWQANWKYAQRLPHRRMRLEGDIRRSKAMTTMLADLRCGLPLPRVAFVVGDGTFQHNRRGNLSVPHAAILKGIETMAPVSFLTSQYYKMDSIE